MAKSDRAPSIRQLTPSWELLRPNFKLIMEHYVPLMYLVILPALVYALGAILLERIRITGSGDAARLQFSTTQIVGLCIMAVGGLWSIINLGPSTLFYLNAISGKPSQLRSYYRRGLRYTPRIIFYLLASGLLVIGGMLLLIVPGFIAIRRYYLGYYYLVDKDLGVIEALRRSGQRSKPKPVRAAIWGIIGVQIVVVFAASAIGLIPLIGVILTQLAVYSVIFIPVLRYREIEPHSSLK